MGYDREKSKMGVQIFWLGQLGRWWLTDRENGSRKEGRKMSSVWETLSLRWNKATERMNLMGLRFGLDV